MSEYACMGARWVDPSGLRCPCGPEVTDWLIRQIINNGKLKPNEAGGAGTVLLLNEFKFKVQSGGDWDFKASQTFKTQSCPELPTCKNTVTICGICLNYDVPGNINFGYVGIKWGIPTEFLHKGADLHRGGER